MTRVCHVLKANHRSIALNHLIAVDVAATVGSREPDTEVHRLRLAAASYWSPARRRQKERAESATFARPAAFWSWSLDQIPSRSRAIVVAHEASYAVRLLDMFRVLPALGFTLKRLSLDEPPFVAHWVEGCPACELANAQAGSQDRARRRRGCTASKHRSLMVWSVTNFTGYSLTQLSKSVGLTCPPLSTKRVSATVLASTVTTRANCLLTWFRTWCRWLSTNDMGVLSPTIAAQSWHAYRHRFMDTPILIHDNASVIDLERRGYHGGRCECRLLGDFSGPSWAYADFNSLYPAVMATEQMPCKLLTTRTYPTVDTLRLLLQRFCLVATVDLTTDQPLFPLRRKGGVVYPVGRFRTTLCTPELAIALDRGLVEGCVRVAVYERAVLFGRYVAELWGHRRAAVERGDEVGALAAKLLMNALYGKFAQRATTWEERGDCPVEDVGQQECWDVRQERWRVFRSVGGRVWEKVPAPEGDDSFPAIAGHVTSAARVRLLGVLERLERHSVAYVDTDGLIVLADQLAQLRDLIRPTELGYLRVERESDQLRIFGPKWYQLGDRLVCKGLSLGAEWLSARKALDWHRHGLAWSIEGNVLDRVVQQRHEMNFRHQFDAGAVDDSGRVYPLVLH